MNDPSGPDAKARHGRRGLLANSSITTKLATIVAINLVGMLLLLGVMTLALNIAGGVRAYVGGEGLWSKGQKDAVYYLAEYARTHAPGDYQSYLKAVAIPLGDRKARLELLKPDYQYPVVEAGFVEGGNAAEDVPNMVLLFRYFGQISYMADAIRIWTEADASIAQLIALGDELHAAIQQDELTQGRGEALLARLQTINAEVTRLEREFSATLGDGARWIQATLTQVILGSTFLLLMLGLWLSFHIARELRAGILRLREGALEVSAGRLSHRIASVGEDELGQLAEAFNTMAEHRQKAESALKTSMLEARSIIETASDAFISMDANGRICDWNHQAENLFGWSRQEVMGENLANRIIPPNLHQAHNRGLAHYLRSGEGPVLNKRIEVMALHRAGHEFPVELTIWPAYQGSSKRFNAFLRDISERTHMIRRLNAQKAAAAALASSPTLEEAAPAVLDAICDALEWDVGALWVPDAKADVLRCVQIRHRAGREVPSFVNVSRNITFARGVGLPGRVWSSASPLWIPDVTQDGNFPRARYALQEDLHGAFAIPLLDDTEVSGVIEFFSRSIQQPDDNLLRMMSMLGTLLGQFIARKNAERALALHTEELARSNAELERFAYIASHDLQEPLRTVTSYTQLLMRRFKQVDDPDAKEFATYITEAVQRMRDLIEGLLAYSRVTRAADTREDADLNIILQQTIANLDASIKSQSARITCDELPVVQANCTLIAHVLQNLLGNALKFHGEQPPRIHVGAKRDGNGWRISVRDHGIGIDPKHAENIFVLFQRLHTREQIPGNGLGLAICKKIIEQQGGRIWVEPANPGCVFHFTLPDHG
jgi:PAS domain S-box-containing protein